MSALDQVARHEMHLVEANMQLLCHLASCFCQTHNVG